MVLQHFFLVVLLATATLLSGCEARLNSLKTPNMTPLSARLQPLFENTKTVCFGRFMIDVPETATVAWGQAITPLYVDVLINQASTLDTTVAQREAELKKQIRFPASKNLPMYLETIKEQKNGQRLVISQREFDTTGDLRIESYFELKNDLFIVHAFADEETKQQTIAQLNDMASRLRPRTESEVPAEPGLCIAHAFLPDKPGMPVAKPEPEHVRIGFRLKEFPDVHLSIYVATSSIQPSESNKLEFQLEKVANDSNNREAFSKIKFLRKGSRQIYDWQDGFEALSRTPEEEQSRSHHDFAMDFQGVANDLYKPRVDIEFKTGVQDNAAGAVKPSLTDEEAVALWDKLTSTIRVRATTAKTSHAAPPAKPLGEMAVTGRLCPQSGWWVCEEPGEVAGRAGKFLQAGQPMPRVSRAAQPSLMQKLTGKAPSQVTIATMWTLASYEAPVAPTKPVTPMQPAEPEPATKPESRE